MNKIKALIISLMLLFSAPASADHLSGVQAGDTVPVVLFCIELKDTADLFVSFATSEDETRKFVENMDDRPCFVVATPFPVQVITVISEDTDFTGAKMYLFTFTLETDTYSSIVWDGEVWERLREREAHR